MKKSTTMLFAALIFAAFGMKAFGQVADDIEAKATVSSGITVTGEENLDFKNVIQGVIKTLDTRNEVTAGTATVGETSGRFAITKGANTSVNLKFTTLPVNLRIGEEGATMPISFDGNYGRLSTEITNTGGVLFNPTTEDGINTTNTGETTNFFEATVFQVYLGGTLTPGAEQEPGDYAGKVELTVTYN